ncbi:MAG: hypothetical protein ACYTBZ_02625 [Planctomycetota bacterium]|jgi:hypothetical protein
MSAFNSAFAFQLGTAYIRFAGGGIVLLSGIICLLIMLTQRERIHTSVWFALIMNIGATLSQTLGHGETPIIGAGLNHFILWLSNLIMFCYLIQNDATRKRILIVFSVLIILATTVGGFEEQKGGRLRIEEGTASSFRNPCSLAYMTALFSISFLFWSLRSTKTIRPILWFMAVMLIIILFRTVTRGGIAAFACGLAVFVSAIMLGRGARISGIVTVAVLLVASSQLLFLVAGQIQYLQERFKTAGQSERLDVYSLETLQEMWETKLFGRGPETRLQSAGFSAHNSFIYTHTCYGGITSLPYLIWQIVLMIRLARMMLSRDLPMVTKMHVLAVFGIALADQLMSNSGYMDFCTLYAFAITEKYTAPYSRRRILQRRYAQYYGTPEQSLYPTYAQPMYQ